MEEWKHTLIFSWVGQFFSIMGFAFALPFMPFYLQELGVTDPEELRIWTGLVSSAAGLTMAIASPLWGYLADRMGKKLMTLRASLGGAIVLAGMGLVHSPEMLLAFRLLQGVFTGTVTAYLTLVVSKTPKERMGLAIGLVNSAIFCGNSVSPLLGGIFADLFGYRASFFVAAGLLFASFLTSLIFVRERVVPRPDTKFSLFTDLKSLLSIPGVLAIVGMVSLYAFSYIMQRPQLPLLVQDIVRTDVNLATKTGLVVSVGGIASVLAGILIGMLIDRGRTLKIGMLCAVASGGFAFAIIFTGTLWQIASLYFLFAFAAGGLDPILKAILGRIVPVQQRGAAFGMIGSARSFGWFLGSLSGGFLAAKLGLRSVFVVSAILFVLIAGFLSLLGRGKKY